eukprot:915463-Prorocentrum_minimum.AAC.1
MSAQSTAIGDTEQELLDRAMALSLHEAELASAGERPPPPRQSTDEDEQLARMLQVRAGPHSFIRGGANAPPMVRVVKLTPRRDDVVARGGNSHFSILQNPKTRPNWFTANWGELET